MTAMGECDMIALLQDILYELKGLRRDIKELKEENDKKENV